MRILVALVLLVLPLQAADVSLDALVQKLQKRYENLGTMKASFTQSYRSKRFSDPLSESGIVYLRKGGLMKWEYQKPESKLFLSDGYFYYYYVAEDKQLVKTPVDQKADEHSPALFLAGRGNFLQDFRAEWADPRPGSHLIKLRPVRPQPDFSYLIVDVDPINGFILRLVVIDQYDNHTEYTFTQIQDNPNLPSNFFSFTPPAGTDIVYQRRDSGQE